MAYVMATAQSGIRTDVVNVDFTRMPGHGFSHTPNIKTPGTQEIIPQPHIRSQFRIVPGKSSDIITPGMTNGVISMHHITVIPETVPFVLFDCFLIEVNVSIQAVFYTSTEWSAAVRKAPCSESLAGMKIIRGWH